MFRTQIELTESESVDEIVGRRGRSRFFTQAVEEKLARLKLIRAAKRAAGC